MGATKAFSAVHGGISFPDLSPGQPSMAARDPRQAMTFSHRQSVADHPSTLLTMLLLLALGAAV